MKKIIMIIITAVLLNLSAVCVSAENNRGGYLVGAGAWAEKAILKAEFAGIVDKDILRDYGKDITRIEFCELVTNVY